MELKRDDTFQPITISRQCSKRTVTLNHTMDASLNISNSLLITYPSSRQNMEHRKSRYFSLFLTSWIQSTHSNHKSLVSISY